MTDVTVVGNVGEPALKFTSGGKAVLEFSLAENHRKREGQEWVDDGTTWRRVTVWEAAAEALSEVLHKGDRVIVVGSERLREFEARDGSKGRSLEVTARHVGIVPRADRASTGGQSQGGQGFGGQADPWASSQPQGWGGADDQPPF